MLNSPISAEAINSFKSIGTATIHEANQQSGAMNSKIKPLKDTMKVCGIALTVEVRPGDNLGLHQALMVAKKGDVIVAQAGGFSESGLWGEIMTIAAMERGAAGLVIDGAVRDVESAPRLGFPIFSAGICMKASGKNFKGRINVPITCGAVLVNPGDLVVGDADGVVVVPSKEVDQVLKKSLEREKKEAGLIDRLKKGELTIHLLGLAEKIKE